MSVLFCSFVVFFFNQKTAYEMSISDWSSDVCSSDLLRNANAQYHSPKPRCRRHCLHDIKKGKRRKTAGDYTACAAHDQLGPVAMHEQLRDGQRQETDQENARKTLDAELLPELDEQQAHADVGH